MRRRTFLHRAIPAAAAAWGFPTIIRPSALGLGGAVAASNRVTLGVVGVGAQGTHDMRAFLNHDDVRVTAICDVNTRHMERARGLIQEKYGSADVRAFSDFRELNRDKSVDAVLMALPVHWHSIPSIDAAGQGKHLYHEKPMAMSYEESRLIRDAVRKAGVVFQFGTQQRSDLKFRWACELARNGRLGALREIQVAVPGGKVAPAFPEEAAPPFVDWERWVGPAPMTPFSEAKLKRDNHENISNFSLGMISCWGIHHLDIALWGNAATDGANPVAGQTVSVHGAAEYPPAGGGCDLMTGWHIRYEFSPGQTTGRPAAPITFVNEGRDGLAHGVRFVGASGWIHVKRGVITASDDSILRDPQNKAGAMPVKLPVSLDHTRDFVDAIKAGSRAIADIETAHYSDTLPQLAAICLKRRSDKPLVWNPQAESFTDDADANALLRKREFRGPWQLGA